MHRDPSTLAGSSPGAVDRAQELVAGPSIHQAPCLPPGGHQRPRA